MDNLRIISEPTAACLANRFDIKFNIDSENHVLLIDIGASGLNVTIEMIEDGIFEVIANNSYESLGGNAIDEVLVDHCAKALKTKSGFEPDSIQR